MDMAATASSIQLNWDHYVHIVAYHLYMGSCFRWIGDMWRAYVEVGAAGGGGTHPQNRRLGSPRCQKLQNLPLPFCQKRGSLSVLRGLFSTILARVYFLPLSKTGVYPGGLPVQLYYGSTPQGLDMSSLNIKSKDQSE